jgi:hypothetical protein
MTIPVFIVQARSAIPADELAVLLVALVQAVPERLRYQYGVAVRPATAAEATALRRAAVPSTERPIRLNSLFYGWLYHAKPRAAVYLANHLVSAAVLTESGPRSLLCFPGVPADVADDFDHAFDSQWAAVVIDGRLPEELYVAVPD